jgi:hypothetical protein
MVLYLLCFDLSRPSSEQQAQLQYWLSYLNSILCSGKQIPNTHAYSSWRVLLVGTKADIEHQNSLKDTLHWQNEFSIIPISSTMYHVSGIPNVS